VPPPTIKQYEYNEAAIQSFLIKDQQLALEERIASQKQESLTSSVDPRFEKKRTEEPPDSKKLEGWSFIRKN